MENISQDKRRIIEALLFGSDEPLTPRQIIDILWSADSGGPRLRMKEDEIFGVIRELNAEYVQAERSYRIVRGLITIVGRAATPGRPLLYGTTQDFLKHFGINDLSELPKPREIDEIMADQGMDMERELLKRMGKTEEEIAEQLGTTVVSENGELHELPPTNDEEGDTPSDPDSAPPEG
jgi:chromosome segregation and condensation protein ScpB